MNDSGSIVSICNIVSISVASIVSSSSSSICSLVVAVVVTVSGLVTGVDCLAAAKIGNAILKRKYDTISQGRNNRDIRNSQNGLGTRV